METLTDLQLWQLATSTNEAIFISSIVLLLLVWSIILSVYNFKQIARMKTDCEEAIKQNHKFNERKTFK